MTSDDEPARRFPAAWLLVLMAAWFLVAAASQWQSVSESYHHLSLLDLQVYRMGGRALLDGRPLYDATYSWDSLPFTYTPFAALLFVPLALLPPDAAAVVMTAASLTCLVRVVVLVARELPRRTVAAIPTTVLGVAIGLSLWPTRSTLEFGQVNLVIMWLVVEDLFGRGRSTRWAGVLLGLAIGIKLTPAFFLLFLLSIKQVRRAVVAAAVAAATVAAGFAVQPDQAWRYWTDAAYDASRTGSPAYVNNQSWNGVITRFTGSPSHTLLWLAVAGATTVGVLVLARRLWRDGATVGAVTVVAVGGLLVSPISWSHHWVWFLPMALWLVVPNGDPEAGADRARRWSVLALVAAVSVARVIFLVPFGDDVEYRHDLVEKVVGNSYVLVALVYLLYARSTLRPSRRATGNLPRHGDHAGQSIGGAGVVPHRAG